MSLIVLLTTLTGCIGNEDSDNPLTGKDTDERMVMSLEKTYPEHDFKTVKKYDKYDGEYYAICADENGLEFKVHTIIYNNIYHFGCSDEYLKEVLKKQGFMEKMEKIANDYGYEIEIDSDYQEPDLVINIDRDDFSVDNVTEMLLEIVNSVEYIPEHNVTDEVFSTGEVKYFSNPDMYMYWLRSGKNGNLYVGGIEFNDRNKTPDELKSMVESDLAKAYKAEERIENGE